MPLIACLAPREGWGATVNVLGLTAGNRNSAACLVRDGRVVARAEECLFTRRLDESGFPRQAVEFCLRSAKIGAGAVGAAVVSGRGPYRGQTAPAPSLFRRILGARPDPDERAVHELDPGIPVRGVPREEANAVGAFLTSPFDEAAVLLLDEERVSFGAGRGAEVRILASSAAPAADAAEAVERARRESGLDAVVVGGARASDRAVLRRVSSGSGGGAPIWIESQRGAEATGAALHGTASRDEVRKSGRSLGPGYNAHQVRTFLRYRDVAAEELPRDSAAAAVAGLLAAGRTVGWFAGRVACGAETVAARAVLRLPPDSGDPLEAAADDAVLAVPAERATALFALDPRVLSPLLASGPGFVLRVDHEEHRALHAVLEALESVGRPPYALARRLARPGEPVACTPRDAWEAFESSPVDAIVMERHLVRRS
jgi:predicted NodU family carbamoyl transferase